MKKSISIFSYLIFLLLTYSKSLSPLNYKNIFLEENVINEEIVINIKSKDNLEAIEIGDKGILYYKTDYNDNENNIFNSSDIEEKTTFHPICTELTTGDIYNITCRLWKPIHENLRLFCKFKESLIDYYQDIKIKDYSFNYGNYQIFIKFLINSTTLYQSDYFPFLYSGEQIINIEDEKDSYYLKFKIESYDNDMLFIGGKFLNTKILHNRKVKEKELICEIKGEDLIGILQINGGNIFLYYYLPRYFDIRQYENVFNIIVNVKNLQKEDIYVGIHKIRDKSLREDDFVAFETILEISQI